MHNLFQIVTVELSAYLGAHLPDLSDQWWQDLVIDRLSFQQQRMVQERGLTSLSQLDFAALLRVFDQNWYELSRKLSLPWEGRNWVKELQTVRNKWSHLPSGDLPPSEVYRDADTLGRMLTMIGASPESLAAAQATKDVALRDMANKNAGEGARPLSPEGSGSEQEPGKTEGSAEARGGGPASAPLFKVGEVLALRSDPRQLVSVLKVIPGAGESRYQVFQNGAKAVYYESQLQPAVEQADDRRTLSANELNAQLTSLQILSPSTANLFSLRSGRITFVPYQYRPVLKLIRADRPRLLIADEVGVGKTIEAGLIIQELRARMDLSSVLIICPKALVAERKWSAEMKRFDEDFTPLDGQLLRHCVQESHLEGEWPEKYAKAILPFSLFDADLLYGTNGTDRNRSRGLLGLDPPPKFDLVIVDEAHHIRNSATYLHQGVRYFCDNAEAVLFLTATPVQLGSEDLYTLLNVLRPDLVIDPISFDQMAAPNRYINAAVQLCRAARDGWQIEAGRQLEAAGRTGWGELFLRESPEFQGAYDRLQGDPVDDAGRVALTRAIEDLYTFSPLINRTRRRDIGEFTTRKPETVPVEFTPAQRRLHDDLLDVIARILTYTHGAQNVKFMMTTIRRQAASCLYGLAPLLRDILSGKLDQLELIEAADTELDADLGFLDLIRADIASILRQAEHLDRHDPKVEAFVQVLLDKARLPNNKALVFSTFRHTLAYLARYVDPTGLRYGLVQGDVPDEARADLRRRFALPKEHPEALDVLLSSEVGCEGLDFQFCDFLINYDLPWNPMRIEQRIGRIDRYGQKSEAVGIINLITPGTVDADIYDRCLWRIGVFQHAVGGNEEILGAITRELHAIADRFDLTPAERENQLRQLADNGVRQIREEQELEARQAELFGLNPPGQSWRREIEAAESFWLSPSSLQRCVALYLEQRVGPDQDYLLGEKALKTLRLSQEARNRLLEDFRRLPRLTDPVARQWNRWLKGGVPTMSVTFDQAAAVENPKAAYLSVTHPLVRQAAHHLRLDEPAYTCLSVRDGELPAGEYSFAIYRWQKQGAKPDETLVPIASDPRLEERLFALMQSAATQEDGPLPGDAEFEALDVRHHSKWRDARANHIEENRQLVAHRGHSLSVSHQARCQVIEDQLARATNEKIRVMKQSELARANADFERRKQELEKAAGSGDIHATPVLFGRLVVEN